MKKKIGKCFSVFNRCKSFVKFKYSLGVFGCFGDDKPLHFTYSNNLISLLLCAYKVHYDKFIITIHNKSMFNSTYLFDIKSIVQNPNSMLYDQFFIGFISMIITRHERDKFIKLLRR